MSPRNYGARLGHIEDAQFQKALTRLGLGEFIQAEPIAFGLFGQNVFLTSTIGEYVLRGCPHYDWQFPIEQFFVELVHQTTKVPVPYPYLYDPSTDIFGWEYVLMPRMSGLQIANPEVLQQLSLEDRMGIARALGRNLADLQQTTVVDHI